MKFLDWYVKLAVGFTSIGAAMEYFMIQTGFCEKMKRGEALLNGIIGMGCSLSSVTKIDDKVTVLEAEKRAEELDPRNQAIREALNPWRKQESMRGKDP